MSGELTETIKLTTRRIAVLRICEQGRLHWWVSVASYGGDIHPQQNGDGRRPSDVEMASLENAGLIARRPDMPRGGTMQVLRKKAELTDAGRAALARYRGETP